MRAKEGIEAECRTAQRSVEKQLKMLDRASEVEKNLNAQIVIPSCSNRPFPAEQHSRSPTTGA